MLNRNIINWGGQLNRKHTLTYLTVNGVKITLLKYGEEERYLLSWLLIYFFLKIANEIRYVNVLRGKANRKKIRSWFLADNIIRYLTQ